MALDDLFQAMNMFKQGVTEYAAARGINQAHQQVLDLKNQQLDAMTERQGLGSIAQNLTMNLASIGAPLSQIQAAVGAVTPAAIEDANDAHLQGLMAGPKGAGLLQLANSQQNFEMRPDIIKETMKEKEDSDKADAKQSTADLKRSTEFGKQLDPTQSRAGEFGKLYQQMFQTKKLNALTNNGANLNLTEANQQEFALGLHRLISGGASAHVDQVKAMLPQSFVNASKRGESYALNEPLPLNNQAWIQSLMATVNREGDVATQAYKEVGYRRAQNYEDLDSKVFDQKLNAAGLNADEYKTFIANGGSLTGTAQSQPAASGVGPAQPAAPSIFSFKVGQ